MTAVTSVKTDTPVNNAQEVNGAQSDFLKRLAAGKAKQPQSNIRPVSGADVELNSEPKKEPTSKLKREQSYMPLSEFQVSRCEFLNYEAFGLQQMAVQTIKQTGSKQTPVGIKRLVWNQQHPLVPKLDPDYVFPLKSTRILNDYMCMPYRRPLYLFGSQGAGKTSLVDQYCARTNRVMMEYCVDQTTEVRDLIGARAISANGGTYFEYGVLSICMKRGYVLMLSEWDRLSPDQQKALNPIMEGRPLLIPETGETITPHPDFRIVLSANTNNAGTSSSGFMSQLGDVSVNDRPIFHEVEGLSKEQSRQVLTKKFKTFLMMRGCKPAEVDEYITNMDSVFTVMLNVAERINQLAENAKTTGSTDSKGSISKTLSMRNLLSWSEWYVLDDPWELNPLKSAYEKAFVGALDPYEQTAVREVLRAFAGVGQ